VGLHPEDPAHVGMSAITKKGERTMIIYSAEWIEDDEDSEYEIRYFETLRAAQNFARRKSSKVFHSTYAVESEAENTIVSDCAPVYWLRGWAYARGGLDYKETNDEKQKLS
jgi:hypothetical protein